MGYPPGPRNTAADWSRSSQSQAHKTPASEGAGVPESMKVKRFSAYDEMLALVDGVDHTEVTDDDRKAIANTLPHLAQLTALVPLPLSDGIGFLRTLEAALLPRKIQTAPTA